MASFWELPKRSKLRKALGPDGATFVSYSLSTLERLLPHVETYDWKIKSGTTKTLAKFSDRNRRRLTLQIGIAVGATNWNVSGKLRRKQVPNGVGAVARTIDSREKDIADCVMSLTGEALTITPPESAILFKALKANFDERVVSLHLRRYWDLQINLEEWFVAIRQLAEQSYENKSITFGCIIDSQNFDEKEINHNFPKISLKKRNIECYLMDIKQRITYRELAR